MTALAANLNEGPNVFKKRIFIDHQLKPGDVFNEDLLDKVADSRLLVLLLSQNYIESKWCGDELEHFIRTHANDPAKPVDVVVVELFPYETFTDVPAHIENLRKRLIHAKFWHQPRDAASPMLAGYPSPHESGPEREVHYWSVLNELRAAIDTRLRALRVAQASPTVTLAIVTPAAPAPSAERSAPPLGTVLLADATEDLEAQHNAVRVELESEGIVVLPDGDCVGLTPAEFDAAIGADLERSDLFVQLLCPTTGRKSNGHSAPLPQLQYQRATAARVAIMQWCERVPGAEQIADPAHARLFDTEFLRAVNLAGFKTEVVARVRAERQKKAAALAAVAKIAPKALRKLIFIDDLANLPELSHRLRAIVKAQNCDMRSLPPSAPLGSNGIDVKELLRPCRAGLTIYVDRGKYASAYNRLVFVLNQVAEGSLPLARWGVYLEQGTVASEFGIESDDVVPVDEQGLAAFLRGL